VLTGSFFPPPPAPHAVLPEDPDLTNLALLTGPPWDELGQTVPVRHVVSRTPDRAIAILDATVYSTGLSFRVGWFSRAEAERRRHSPRVAIMVGRRIIRPNSFTKLNLARPIPAPQLASQNACTCGDWPGGGISEWWVYGWRPGDLLKVRVERPDVERGTAIVTIDPARLAASPRG